MSTSTMTDTRDLVCEGGCNPDRPAVDREVARYRAEECRSDPYGRQPIDDPRLLRRLRALRHTPHRQTRVAEWTCQVCGTARWF